MENNKMLCITFGRHLPNVKSFYFITIVKEEYDNHCNVIYASIVKGFFKAKGRKK